MSQDRSSNKIQKVHAFLQSLEVPKAKIHNNPVSINYIPIETIHSIREPFKGICNQINTSYHHQIFDGSAVLLRKLVEMLLIESYKAIGETAEIKDVENDYLQLSAIIKKAEQNMTLNYTRNTKQALKLFKDKGDLSAHNPYYIAKKDDLDLHHDQFRVMIEELIYKAGIIKREL